MKNKFLHTIFLTLLVSWSFAQDMKVLVRNTPDSLSNGRTAIHVKWFDFPNIYTEKGLDVYRQETNGNWQKVNEKPIIKQDSITDIKALEKTPYVYALAETVNKATKEEMKGLMLVQLVFSSFRYHLFAEFLGIQYIDMTVEQGKKYRYQLRLASTGEVKGESDWLIAGPYQPQEAFDKVQFKVKRKKINIEWENDNDRCWGIDIYRTAPGQKEIKLTKTPIAAAAITDAEKSNPFFTDDSLAEESNYVYRIQGIDYFGYPTASYTQEVFLPDMTPPKKPLIRHHGMTGYIWKCSWEVESQEDLKGYYVYRGTTLQDSTTFKRVSDLITPLDTNSFQQDLEFVKGASYYYIASVDAVGNEMTSRRLFADVHDITPPLPPTGLEALADSGRILLQWEASPSEDVMGYVILRAINSEDKGYEVDLNEPFSQLSFVDTLPSSAKNNFVYKVVAIDSAFNRSEASPIAIAKMPDVIAPDKPLIINSYQKDQYLVIEWLPNTDLDLKGYEIYRSEGADTATYQKINLQEIPVFSHHYTDKHAVYGKDYFYYVIAYDSAGNKSSKSEIYGARNSAKPENDISTEITQLTIGYNKKEQAVLCKWEPKNPESFSGAVVYRSDEQLNQIVPLTGLLSEYEFQDTDVIDDKKYSYQIRFYMNNGVVIKSKIEEIKIKK